MLTRKNNKFFVNFEGLGMKWAVFEGRHITIKPFYLAIASRFSAHGYRILIQDGESVLKALMNNVLKEHQRDTNFVLRRGRNWRDIFFVFIIRSFILESVTVYSNKCKFFLLFVRNTV